MQDFSIYNGPGKPLREAQLASLDIFIEFDRVCKDNNLTYWMDFGTLLGAVRHKGFVPWDDDIDVCMPIQDFNRFIKIGQDKLKKGYFVQTDETDPGCDMNKGIFKVRKDGTLFINDYDDFRKNYHKGTSIDVFADVSYPSVSPRLFSFFRKRISKAYGLFQYNPPLNFKNIICYFLFPISYVFFKGLWALITMFRKKDREFVTFERMSYGYPTLKTDMVPVSQIEFENHMFNAPGNPDARLKNIYGDYMTIPPVEKQRIHAEFICVDTSKQYSNIR